MELEDVIEKLLVPGTAGAVRTRCFLLGLALRDFADVAASKRGDAVHVMGYLLQNGASLATARIALEGYRASRAEHLLRAQNLWI